ncbi:methyltransferase domain-containing protein [Nocardia asiatica]|uniref:methyltransferase domain-containing protein n=1 Tax=Nocardia asiatica TaxID=209252 RepID=UPI003EE2FDF8
MGDEHDPVDASRYLLTGRSLREYRAMFALTDDDLRGDILDCPGGAASFAAETAELGARVIAADPVYRMPAAELTALASAELDRNAAHTTAAADRYVWGFYGDPDGHRRLRRTAARRFAEDLRANPWRYRYGVLPALDFPDRSFDLVVSSHLLFTYADRLDFAFHSAALRELARVCRGEVRVFPLVDHAGGRLDDLVHRLRDALRSEGVRSDLVGVDFEFQRGASSMLRLRVP